MLRRRVGTILVGLGTTIIVASTVGMLVVGSDDEGLAAAPATSSTTVVVTTTEPVTTTVAPTTTIATTTTAVVTTTEPVTTTVAPTTTTTIAPEAAIAAFVEEFGKAIEAADVDWLLDRLHSAMILGYGEDVCKNFISTEILELKQYTLTGSVTGPTDKTLTTGVGDVTVTRIYTAETSFVFKGSAFDAKADFVLDDPITWLAICR